MCRDCPLSASQKDIPCISPQRASSAKTKNEAFYPLMSPAVWPV
ncbi:rCG31130 [Rattus norvegicus]|uniref:RCG31130 n=1 Tax=Rattus norvegicus TaxID=10116 RepID=A6IT21_RAT|nr:rCG31130 [Rattus norvegicus]